MCLYVKIAAVLVKSYRSKKIINNLNANYRIVQKQDLSKKYKISFKAADLPQEKIIPTIFNSNLIMLL